MTALLRRLYESDYAHRVVATFAEAFVAVLLAGSVTDLSVSTVQAAAVAGLAAVAAMVKESLRQRLASRSSG